jgi:ketopantoate reductase
MRILVWGATPVAAWTATRLHQLGHETLWLTDENIQHDIQRFGRLTLRSPQRELYVKDLTIGTEIDALLKPPLDHIMLLMPTWALGSVIREMSRRIPPSKCPPVLVLGTGIGARTKLEDFFASELITEAFTTRQFVWPHLANGSPAHETVVSDGFGGFALTRSPRAESLAHLLRMIGFGPVSIHETEPLEWSNLLWKIQANALPGVLRVPPEHVYADDELFAIEYRQIREAMEIIDRKKISLVDLPGVAVRRLGWQIRMLPPRMLRRVLQANVSPPSLQTELEAGHGRSDAAYLNGVIAKEAHDMQLHTPVNHTLAISLTDIAEGRALWRQYTREYLQVLLRIANR